MKPRMISYQAPPLGRRTSSVFLASPPSLFFTSPLLSKFQNLLHHPDLSSLSKQFPALVGAMMWNAARRALARRGMATVSDSPLAKKVGQTFLLRSASNAWVVRERGEKESGLITPVGQSPSKVPHVRHNERRGYRAVLSRSYGCSQRGMIRPRSTWLLL